MAAVHSMEAGAWETDNHQLEEAEISISECTAREKLHKAKDTAELSSTEK